MWAPDLGFWPYRLLSPIVLWLFWRTGAYLLARLHHRAFPYRRESISPAMTHPYRAADQPPQDPFWVRWRLGVIKDWADVVRVRVFAWCFILLFFFLMIWRSDLEQRMYDVEVEVIAYSASRIDAEYTVKFKVVASTELCFVGRVTRWYQTKDACGCSESNAPEWFDGADNRFLVGAHWQAKVNARGELSQRLLDWKLPR